ncbi:GNAT family protein [Frankia sp. Cr1]|uniref:GNAT family N-acetyltransferase n=1 Tax=Frankia sp. Cr1 TaxID=3073931 RepID=UPI002AD4239D|nr:GNAT family protein [Frankia sp. Cr1]
MYPVRIDSDGLCLREFTEDDIDALLAVYGDPTVTRHMSFEPRNRGQVAATIAMAIRTSTIEPRVEYSLAVAIPDTHLMIGFGRLAIDSGHPAQRSAQIGFALRADQWGRGYGAETVRLLHRLGFAELGMHRIWGARSPDNTVSDRLMRRLGMIEEGRIRGHVLVRDAWRDSIVHSILEDEWTPSTHTDAASQSTVTT